MKRIARRVLPLLALAVVGAVLAACSAGGSGPGGQTGAGSKAQTSESPSGDRAWKPMPVGKDAEATLAFLPNAVKQFNDTQAGTGAKPLDVSGREPVFVGYVVLVYARNADGTYDTAQIQVIGGELDSGSGSFVELEKERVYVARAMPALVPVPSDPTSGDASDACAKALAFMEREYADTPWEAKVWGHVFMYDYDGEPFVLGVSVDGSASYGSGPRIE